MFYSHDRATRRLRRLLRRLPISRTWGARRLVLEELESRRVLSTLTVIGTAAADVIAVYRQDDLLTVEVNGATFSVPYSSIDHIVVSGEAGDDSIRVDASVEQT